ncbi:unnamed protein product, partial [Closterium sp. Yama58-4]
VIYTTVMKLFARAGRTDGVARIVALLREEGSREDGLFRLDSKTICALIAAYNSMGDLNSAQEVFEAARASTPPGEWDVVVWNAMVAAYGRAGKVKQAEELLLQMEAQADGADGRKGGSEGEEGAHEVDTGAAWGSVEADWGRVEADGGSVETDRVGQSMGGPGGAESVGRVQRGAAGSIISSTQEGNWVQGAIEESEKRKGSAVNGSRPSPLLQPALAYSEPASVISGPLSEVWSDAPGELWSEAREGLVAATATVAVPPVASLEAQGISNSDSNGRNEIGNDTASGGVGDGGLVAAGVDGGGTGNSGGETGGSGEEGRGDEEEGEEIDREVERREMQRREGGGRRGGKSTRGYSGGTGRASWGNDREEARRGRGEGGARRGRERIGGGGGGGGLEGGGRELSPPRFGPTLNAYNSLLNAYAKAGDVDKAEKTFKRLMARGFYPSTVTFNTLFSLYASLPSSSSSLSAARRLHALMLQMDVPLDVYSCCSLIGLLSRSGQVEEAVGLFERMKAQGVQPDSHVFSAMIAMFARHGKLEAALRTFKEMKAAGCAVDMPVLTSMIGVYHRLGLLEEASAAAMDAIVSVFGGNKGFFGYREDMKCRCAVHMPVLTSMIGVYHQLGLLEEASAAAMDAIVSGSEWCLLCLGVLNLEVLSLCLPRVLTSMIGVYHRLGLLEEASAAAMDAIVSGSEWCLLCLAVLNLGVLSLCLEGCAVDKPVLTSMIGVYHRLGLLEEASAAAMDPIVSCLGVSNLGAEVLSLKAGQLDAAEALFAEILADESGSIADLAAHTTMISVYGKHGLVDKAKLLFTSLRGSGRDLDAVIWNAMLSALGKNGRVEEAKELFAEMQECGPAPTVYSYSIMIDAYGKADRILDASTTFARMLSSGLRPSLVTFNSMLAAYRRAGMVNDAAALFRRMRAEGVPPSHVSYAILIHTHAQAGDLREATRLFRELQDSGCAVDNPTLHRITSMLRWAGRSHSSML